MLRPHEGASEEILLLRNTIEPHNYLIYDNCNRDRAVNKKNLNNLNLGHGLYFGSIHRCVHLYDIAYILKLMDRVFKHGSSEVNQS